MNKHYFKIRQIDKKIFDLIKSGQKVIETRAATEKYRKVKEGDAIIFTCGKERTEKIAGKINFYKNIDEMVEKVDFREIIPFADSLSEMKRMYYNFPNYKEKIKEFGILTFELK